MCAKGKYEGAVALALVNFDQSRTITAHFDAGKPQHEQGQRAKKPHQEQVLVWQLKSADPQAPLQSRDVALRATNGTWVPLRFDGSELPPLPPATPADTGAAVALPPLSYALVVLAGTQAPACASSA